MIKPVRLLIAIVGMAILAVIFVGAVPFLGALLWALAWFGGAVNDVDSTGGEWIAPVVLFVVGATYLAILLAAIWWVRQAPADHQE
jgi:hypothetical protein